MAYGTENGRISRLPCMVRMLTCCLGVCAKGQTIYMHATEHWHVQAIKTEVRQIVAQKMVCIVLQEHLRTSISNTYSKNV